MGYFCQDNNDITVLDIASSDAQTGMQSAGGIFGWFGSWRSDLSKLETWNGKNDKYS